MRARHVVRGIVLGIALLGRPVAAAVFTVDDTADAPDATPGDGICATATVTCTVRAAIQEANALAGEDEVDVPAGLYVVSSALSVTAPVTIVGASASGTILDGGGGAYRVVAASAPLTLGRLTIRNGGSGGVSAPSLTASDCVFTQNHAMDSAGFGGGVSATGVTILRSTFALNEAQLGGGGLAVTNGEVRDSTFTGNVAHGVGIFVGGDAILTSGAGTLLITDSTLLGDVSVLSVCQPPPGGGCTVGTDVVLRNVTGGAAEIVTYGPAPHRGSIAVRNSIMYGCLAGYSQGHNLFVTSQSCQVNPALGDMVAATAPLLPLADNGGPTMTRLPQPGSVVVDAGGSDCDPVDQRAVRRPIGAGCDIGAVEAGCGDGNVDPGEQCDDGNTVSGDGCDSNCTVTGCGNGIVTAGEECDDGNAVTGDCCDASCQLEPAGGPCASDGNACTDDTCAATGVCRHTANTAPCDDGNACTTGEHCAAGACTGGTTVVCGDDCLACYPDAGCGPLRDTCVAARPGGASLVLRRPASGNGDLVTLKWQTDAPVTVDDFLDPTTQYSNQLVCVYDANDQVVLRAFINLGDSECDGKPCWRATGTPASGYVFRDPTGSADGIVRAKLLAVGPPHATRRTIDAFGHGANVSFGAAGPLALPVRALFRTSASGFIPSPPQFFSVSHCFDASFGAARANTGAAFRARSD